MTSFALKIVAIVSMFCDHFGDALIGHFSFFNLIGRIAFPIFAFQISEGYSHTKDLKKYFMRLGIFAVISQIPFSLFSYKYLGASPLSLNVFFTLFIGLLAIHLWNKGDGAFVSNLKQEGHTYSSKKETVHLTDSTTPTLDHKRTSFYISRILGIVVVLLLAYLANVLNTDYGFWGVIVIFAFYLFKDKKAVMLTSFVVLCIIRYGLDIINYGFNYAYVLLCIFTAIAAIFIGLYNGKQGKKIKYLLYFFYPVHLLLLYFIF